MVLFHRTEPQAWATRTRTGPLSRRLGNEPYKHLTQFSTLCISITSWPCVNTCRVCESKARQGEWRPCRSPSGDLHCGNFAKKDGNLTPLFENPFCSQHFHLISCQHKTKQLLSPLLLFQHHIASQPLGTRWLRAREWFMTFSPWFGFGETNQSEKGQLMKGVLKNVDGAGFILAAHQPWG